MRSSDAKATAVVSGLHTYPLKSGRGVSVSTLDVEPMGPRGDRRYMVVDLEGQMVTQRTAPKLALVDAEVRDGGLGLAIGEQSVLAHPSDQAMAVRIWDDTVAAQRCSADADRLLSDLLGTDVALVHIADDTLRQVDPDYASVGDAVGFADGFSFLLLSEASLQDLNGRLAARVTMQHFRPNIVVSGVEAFEEDTWATIRIGPITFEVVKPCARCSMTTVDPDRGVKAGPEPLSTLATYRRIRSPQSNEVFFGQNLVHRGSGVIRVGHKVEVLRSVSATPTIEFAGD